MDFHNSNLIKDLIENCENYNNSINIDALKVLGRDP